MLTTKALMRLIKQDLSCPICHSRKSSKAMRQLPCQHCCCENCLECWSQTQPETGGRPQLHRQLSCPFCRCSATIPTEGVKAFPTNYNERTRLLQDLLVFLKTTQETSFQGHACALCPFDVGEQALHLHQYCLEGGLTLCSCCQSRFPVAPSAPPVEEDLQPVSRRWQVGVVWTSESTSRGRYSDAVIVKSSNRIVACDSYKGRLFVFSTSNGKCIQTIETSYKPFCMAHDEKKDIILATTFNSTSLRYLDVNKLKDTKVTKKVKASHQPQGLARLPDGNTVVAEMNNMIAVYDLTGATVGRWRCDKQPEYVAVADEFIVISSREADCIMTFDLHGNRKWKLELTQPRGVAVDDKNRVLVVHEGPEGDAQVTLLCLRTGQLLGQLDLPPVDTLNSDKVIKAIPFEDKLLLVYNHFIQMTTLE